MEPSYARALLLVHREPRNCGGQRWRMPRPEVVVACALDGDEARLRKQAFELLAHCEWNDVVIPAMDDEDGHSNARGDGASVEAITHHVAGGERKETSDEVAYRSHRRNQDQLLYASAGSELGGDGGAERLPFDHQPPGRHAEAIEREVPRFRGSRGERPFRWRSGSKSVARIFNGENSQPLCTKRGNDRLQDAK